MLSPDLIELEQNLIRQLEKAATLLSVESLEREILGRKGIFNALLEDLKKLPPEEKQKVGKEINLSKGKIANLLSKKKNELEEKKLEEDLKKNKIDPSLPSYPFSIGRLHPLTQILEEVSKIFIGLGFTVQEGPEIETDENNFGALNIPLDHPARDMHDTFYLSSLNSNSKTENSKLLLRTHTSPVQIRVMREMKPPIRMIAPGRVYRHEAMDATHSSVFHQVEGLAVDQNTSFADLKGTLELFNKKLFGKDVQSRFRPSYFPFVEPGAEVDISCALCKAGERSNCPVCKGSGWIEMLGAGMVHPNVFKAVGYDPEKVSGFAFGLGIERIAMIRYGIDDMRLFFENHLDFLSQF